MGPWRKHVLLGGATSPNTCASGTVLLSVLSFKSSIDLSSCITLSHSIANKEPVNDGGQLFAEDCLINRSPILNVHQKHNCFCATTESDNEHLAEVQRCVSHVVNP